MLIRLLVVVLTLVGPMPFRVCTCAAGQSTRQSTRPVTPKTLKTAPPERKKCCCGHHTRAHSTIGNTTGREVSAVERTHSHDPVPHERDCPAANPLVRDTGAPPVTDAPNNCAAAQAVAGTDSLFARVLAPPSDHPHPPRLPLYLTFLSLRN
jgi:hypothetical protein